MTKIISYQLTTKLQGSIPVDVSANEAKDLRDAFETLSALWDIEELFSLFALSYQALEKVSVLGGLDYLYGLRSSEDDESFFEELHDKINLSILTLLTSYRSYDDQIPQRLRKLENTLPSIVKEGRIICSAVYDSSLEYRIVCNLRNVVQHGRLALAGMFFGRHNQYQDPTQKPTSSTRSRMTMNPYILVSDFLDSDLIQAPVRKSVENLNLRACRVQLTPYPAAMK